mgnify:CR=1 FL=1
MTILLGLSFFVLGLFFSVIEKRNNNIVALVTLLLLILLFAFSYDNADYDAYETLYLFLKNSRDYSLEAMDIFPVLGYVRTDYGYVFITKLFYDAGVSYLTFRVILIAGLLSIIFWVTRKLTLIPIFVLYLYFIYPSFFDVIQIRNWCVEIGLLVGMYWMASREKLGDLGFVLSNVIAATIHIASVIYLPFLVFHYIRRYKCGQYFIKIMCCLGVFAPVFSMFLVDNVDQILLFVLSLDVGGANYFAEPIGVRRYIAYVLVLAMSGTMYLIKRQYEKGAFSLDVVKKRYMYYTYELSIYLLTLAPLFSINRELARIPRNFLLLFYIAIAIYITNVKSYYTRAVLVMLSVVFSVVYGYVDFYMTVGAVQVQTILQNNIISDFFAENFGI